MLHSVIIIVTVGYYSIVIASYYWKSLTLFKEYNITVKFIAEPL